VVQALEHAPAGRQRRVDVDTTLECRDCARYIVHGRETVATLLIYAAEARMLALKAFECRERCNALVQAALIYGREVRGVATFGQLGNERRDRNQSVAVTAPLSQLANPSQLHRIFIRLQLCIPILHR
jgi:hypothetical protein